MATQYSEKTKAKCIALRLSGRTVKSINQEYGLGVGTLKNWTDAYYKETDCETIVENESYALLKKENEELKKELDFLKKAASYFASQQKK